eukprot:1872503-Prymnesium_polylepis.1
MSPVRKCHETTSGALALCAARSAAGWDRRGSTCSRVAVARSQAPWNHSAHTAPVHAVPGVRHAAWWVHEPILVLECVSGSRRGAHDSQYLPPQLDLSPVCSRRIELHLQALRCSATASVAVGFLSWRAQAHRLISDALGKGSRLQAHR